MMIKTRPERVPVKLFWGFHENLIVGNMMAHFGTRLSVRHRLFTMAHLWRSNGASGAPGRGAMFPQTRSLRHCAMGGLFI